jgi:hypothetical protein
VNAVKREAAGVLLAEEVFLVISQIQAGGTPVVVRSVVVPSTGEHLQDCTARGRDSGSLQAPAGKFSIKKTAAKRTVAGVGGHEAAVL